jgi:hypothetical protein
VLDRSVENAMPHGQYPPPRQTRPRAKLAPLFWAMAAVGTLVGLFLLGAAAQNAGRDTDSAAATATAGQPKGNGQPNRKVAEPPGIGDAVRDGKFEFVISRADCARSTVGSKHLNRKAQGKFCVVHLSVRNIADQPQLFLGSAQKAFDAAGTEFTDDKIAGLYANDDTQTFLQKIDPGDKVVGKIVFDVPATTALTIVELHDSFFSGGVRVTLPA